MKINRQLLFILRLFLFPFAILYGLLMILRNLLYRIKLRPSVSYNFPIILVGNILVGGTGKTPMVTYIVDLLLKNKYKIATLSRGYGRKTKGFLQADENSDARQIGDEPLQLYHQFGKEISVAVCEDRNIGIQTLIPHHQVIVMDDAFQHRAVQAGMNMVLFPFDSFFQPQFMLPMGNLREPLAGAKRADIIIVSKCPDTVTEDEMAKIIYKINPLAHQKIFFTKVRYHKAKHLYQNTEIEWQKSDDLAFEIFSGIAHPQDFIQYVSTFTSQVHSTIFADHHPFSVQDINKIIAHFHKLKATNSYLLTTEKDAQRLKSSKFENLLRNLPIYYLPIQVEFLQHSEAEFIQIVTAYVKIHARHGGVYTAENATI